MYNVYSLSESLFALPFQVVLPLQVYLLSCSGQEFKNIKLLYFNCENYDVSGGPELVKEKESKEDPKQ